MKILVYLGHPAHFYLYKNVITNLRKKEHVVEILIKKKDILQQLLDDQGWKYHNILKEGRKNNKFAIAFGTLKRICRELNFCLKYKPDILTGTSVENSFVGPFLNVPAINCNEDDASVVPFYAKLSYPGASAVLNPTVCNSGKWDSKATKYKSYQELAYLHPNHFNPDESIVKGYGIEVDNPYFIFRFASLHAHHDKGINGINTEIAQKLIDILSPHGDVYITSERPLEPQFEKYRIHINPLDMHHVLAFASIYIGDSQTMAAEAGVLGVPFVRFNDFVGRIGYLRELEDVYHLGYGIRADTKPFVPTKVDWIDEEPKVQPCGADAMYEVVKNLLAMDASERKELFQQRRHKMLSEKIDYAKFLTWFIENYPDSKTQVKDDDAWWQQFK